LTIGLVPVHLLLALPLTGKNEEILCRYKLREEKQDKKDGGDGQHGFHNWSFPHMTAFISFNS
jgi:hypothetical protein